MGNGRDVPTGVTAQVTPASAPPVSPAVLDASLRNSVKDALAWSIMQGAGTNFLTPFVILGGQGLLHLGAFTGLPFVGGAIVQWWAANVTDALGRRTRIIVGSAFLQALTWLPICAAIFMPAGAGYWLVLASYVAFVALANFGVPAWQSVMGDLVPAERRGRYFGVRNGLSYAVQTSAFLGAGWWLTLCERREQLALLGLAGRDFGFLVLFGLSCIARLVSTGYLARVHEPPYRQQRSDRFTLLEFVCRAPRAHFGRFVFYSAVMNMGIGLVTPFLGWYLLDELGFGPGRYATVLTASMLASVAAQPLWGRLNDRIGSKRVLAIGGVGLVLVPVLLLLCTTFWQFVGAMAYEGVTLAAFLIATTNYVYDVVTPPKRTRCTAYLALFVGFGTALGNIGGALLAEYAPTPLHWGSLTIGHPFSVVLLAAVTVRMLGNLLLLGSFEEFRLSRPRFDGPAEQHSSGAPT